MIGSLLGGVGLFLLGMGLLTDGLQSAAGDALRGALRKYTRTRFSGIVTGAVATALVQSSSATTIATIGFVGAGLLPFSQAVGVVYGANVGTTTTAWIVSTVGLKVKMSLFALPLVGLGAMARLLLRGRRAAIGTAVAGFGLIFVGIDVLQSAMAGLAEHVDPASFAGSGIAARLALVAIGIAMTVVMQSSSAAVTTTLTAVHAGAIDLEHAAAVVIGQNVGTTVKALVSSLGAPVAARRTALAHIVFNLGTGVLAIGILPLFVALVARAAVAPDPALALAAFHTAFNLLGVLVFLPFTERLIATLERMVPERRTTLVERLSRARGGLPAVVVEAARLTACDIAAATLRLARQVLGGKVADEEVAERCGEIRAALSATREHVRPVRSDPSAPSVYREHVSVLHALDHLQKLVEALGERRNAAHATSTPMYQKLVHELRSHISGALTWLFSATASPSISGAAAEARAAPTFESLSRMVADWRRAERPRLLEATARGEIPPDEVEWLLDGLRWIDRLGYHVWRTLHHLDSAQRDPASRESPAPDGQGQPEDENFEAR